MILDVELRAVEETDLTLLHRWYNSEVAFGDFDESIPHNLDEIRQSWKQGDYNSFFRIITVDAIPIGFADAMVDKEDPETALICVIITEPSYRGRGIGTCVHQKLVSSVFNNSPAVLEIKAWTADENWAEQRTLEKAGLKLHPGLPQKQKIKGQWRNLICFSLRRI